MTSFKAVVEAVGLGIDALGVVAIVLGLLVAMACFSVPTHKRHWGTSGSYRAFRQDIGRGILLGLEFLVAADIIRTVAVAPTVQNVLVLGLIVLIRTFLSMALQVELEGRWPWQPAQQARVDAVGKAGDPAPQPPDASTRRPR